MSGRQAQALPHKLGGANSNQPTNHQTPLVRLTERTCHACSSNTHLGALAEAQCDILHAGLHLSAVPQKAAGEQDRQAGGERQLVANNSYQTCSAWGLLRTCKTATLGKMQNAATHSDWKALLKSITEPLKVRPKGPSAAAAS